MNLRSEVTGVPGRETTIGLYRDHINSGFASLAEVLGLPQEVRSEGCLVFDEQDQAYLDCGGYGVFILGHRHPRVLAAVREQLDLHPMATRSLINPAMAQAAGTLAGVTPAGLDHVFFLNSGAEAVELGIKIARLHGRQRLIAMDGGFHGKTCGALSVTSKPAFRSPFGPLLPDVEFLQYGDLVALRDELASHPGKASVILEPMQGEAGAIVPQPGYLKSVADLCRDHGAILIVDEIQTGLGRLGTWWGIDDEGVVPDLLLIGKGLSGGIVPVAAVAGSAEMFAPLEKDPLLHSSTFAGSPIAMAAAKAAVEVIRDDELPGESARIGNRILAGLEEIVGPGRHPLINAVRGKGLLIGIGFREPHLAGDFQIRMLGERVVVSHSLGTNHVVRLTPPAIMTDEQIEWLLGAVAASLEGMMLAWDQPNPKN